MITCIVFLPLFNFVFIVTFARLITRKFLFVYGIAAYAVAIIAIGFLSKEILRGGRIDNAFGSWIGSGLFFTGWDFVIDFPAFVMLLVVLGVSTAVHVYSLEYMNDDPHLPRFVSYLSLFTFFMLILISANNFVGLFLGWEGVGLCSYLLISFWFTRVQANKAALKAMIMNRVADLFYVLALSAIFFIYQSAAFEVIFAVAPFLSSKNIIFLGVFIDSSSAVGLLLFVAAMGKSAQLGLHTWLPDAMEGPTPVSALIHAATMVTAGVFLIIRSAYIFELTPTALVAVTFVGAGTMFFAATAGLVQNDLKKIIAYSTCSQLGYMIFVCGLSQYALSLFHLSNHAFFKALLFLSAGAIIHGFSNEQDIRKMGGLSQTFPFTYAMFLVGSLALAGFPFLSGFYSKDIIIESAASSVFVSGVFAYWLSLITAFFTTFYSFRLLHASFLGTSKSPRVYISKAHEITNKMLLALCFLSANSIFLGYATKDIFIGLGENLVFGNLSTLGFEKNCLLGGEFLPFYVKIIPFIGFIVAVAGVFTLYGKVAATGYFFDSAEKYKTVYRFLTYKWYFDVVYNLVINQPILEGAYRVIFALVDKGVLEVVGPTGVGNCVNFAGFQLTRAQTGKVYEYAWFMLFVTYTYFCAMVALGWY